MTIPPPGTVARPLPDGPAAAVPPAKNPAPAAALSVGDALEMGVAQNFGPGTDTYHNPTAAEWVAYRDVVTATERTLQAGSEMADVQKTAADLGCELSLDRGCWMLEDHQRGWGTVIFRVHPHSGLIVEVPHPGFDWGTPELGWRAFQQFDADALVVAGADRGNRTEPSPDVPAVDPHGKDDGATFDPWRHAQGVPDYSISDPTHARGTPFEAAHEALTGSRSIVLQLHGFNAAKHHQENAAFPADRQIILTPAENTGYYPPHLLAANQALVGAGYHTEVVSFVDRESSELGALPNVQHGSMAARGLIGPGKSAEFIHVEFDTSLRRTGDRDAIYTRILDALTPVFGASPSPVRPTEERS